jgi:twitching motility protein PilT
MAEAFELRKMLEEILVDEEVGPSKVTKLSQEDIRRLLENRQQHIPKTVRPSRRLLGEMLVEEGQISAFQLNEALEAQNERGGRLGSIIAELGYIQLEKLIDALAKQHGVKGVNIFDVKGVEQTLSLIPSRLILKRRVIPLSAEGATIRLGIEDPENTEAIHEIEFMTGRRVEPVIVPSYQMDLVVKCVEENGGRLLLEQAAKQGLRGPTTVQDMLAQLAASEASDLLLTAGVSPTLKVQHTLQRMNMPICTSEQCIAYAKALMTEKQWERFLKQKELDFAFSHEGLGRFRVNAYQQKGTISLAVRRIPEAIPSLKVLGLPTYLEKYAMKPGGLILIAAPTGHGKTTTLNTMVDIINSKRRCNVISLEDPVEHLHKSKKSNVNQREIGTDADSFAEGLKRIFRQAPDVIVIGEMRDVDTCEIAIRAASSGHLVLSTIHAANTIVAVEGLIGRFPLEFQAHIQYQLAEALLLVISQRLAPGKDGAPVALAYEKLAASQRVRNLIRENKLHSIRAQTPQEAEDFSSMDYSLTKLVREGRISMDSALMFADNIDFVKRGS